MRLEEVTMAEDKRQVSAYVMPPGAVLARLGSRAGGLTGQEAARRRGEVREARRRPRWVEVLRELAESLTEPLQLLLSAVGCCPRSSASCGTRSRSS